MITYFDHSLQIFTEFLISTLLFILCTVIIGKVRSLSTDLSNVNTQGFVGRLCYNFQP